MAKVFEVGTVLPTTTQLRIYFNGNAGDAPNLASDNNNFYFIIEERPEIFAFRDGEIYFEIFDNDEGRWIPPFNGTSHNYMDIDTSSWSLSKRTISNVDDDCPFTWEDLAPAPTGYSITFEENGGTTQTDLTEQTALPNPLPIPTKSGYTFVNWYYDSAFTQKANAGDTIESNVTLYAKWHNLGSLFTEIADAIRSKDGTSENIRDVDFGERVKQIQGAKEEETKTVTPNFSSGNQVITPTSGKVLSQVTLTKPTDLLPENIAKNKNVCGVVGTSFIAVELTQTQYDALSTKDSNTYYLIVEVE